MSRIGLVVPALVILVACSDGDMSDLRAYVQGVKERKPGPIAPLPELEPIGPLAFAPQGQRDPFVPDRPGIAPAPVPVGGDIAPDPLRSREALERFPLDSLAMVGTLARGDIIRALIAISDRTMFQVGVGDYIDTHNGRITHITEERIELTEIISEGGVWRERQATLTLRAP